MSKKKTRRRNSEQSKLFAEEMRKLICPAPDLRTGKQKRGLTVKAAAKKVGVSQSLWYRWKDEIDIPNQTPATKATKSSMTPVPLAPTAFQPGHKSMTPNAQIEYLEHELDRSKQRVQEMRDMNMGLVRVIGVAMASE